MQVARFLDPFLLVDQDAVHQRDLAGRAAEPDAADLEPDAQRLAKGHGVLVRFLGLGHLVHVHLLCVRDIAQRQRLDAERLWKRGVCPTPA